MSQPFTAVKVTDGIYWVGAVDWALRDFHGYATERGTTYNAYLVMADRITLVDTVKRPFAEEMFSRIASVVNPKDISYIISNHSEMDHSGCLPEAVERIQPEAIFASANGVKVLKAHFHALPEVTAVRPGQDLSLGNKTLSFIETRMLHWPDSMFSFLAEDGILFSQDGFGMHLAGTKLFDDEVDDAILDHEAAKYYANILLPFAAMVNLALGKASGLPIKMILPDHGPVWRSKVGRILEAYARWAAQEPTRKAVIVYDSMWESTDTMAKAIEDGLVSEGIAVRSMRLRENHRSNVAAELLDAGAVIVGSPTLNNNLFPTVADILTYLKGLKPRNLVGAAFGSYGWSPAAMAQVKDILTAMQIDLVEEPLSVQYVPGKDDLVRCRELGRRVAAVLKERAPAS